MVLEFSRLKMALMIIALVLDPCISTSDVASAAAVVVTAGSSLTGTKLEELAYGNYTVNCAIQVENWTRFLLRLPIVRMYGNGVITTDPIEISPATKEAFAVRKPKGTVTGVSGTVSWLVGDTQRLFSLMWSVPFDHNIYSNWMGVGMSSTGETQVPTGRKLFDQMYYGDNTKSLTFKRAKNTDDNPIIYRNDQFEITGWMTKDYQAQVEVVIRPTEGYRQDLAPSILAQLGERRK